MSQLVIAYDRNTYGIGLSLSLSYSFYFLENFMSVNMPEICSSFTISVRGFFTH